MHKLKLITLILALLFGPALHATAILNTDYAIVSGEYGSTYPTLPGNPTDTNYLLSDILTSGFGRTEHWSACIPNCGRIGWSTTETWLGIYGGQEVSIFNDPDYGYQGSGFSYFDFLWSFTVDGIDAVMHQDLSSGSGAGETILIDLTTATTVSTLSAKCMGCPTYKHAYDTINLIDGHSYLLAADMMNTSRSDGWIVEYYATLDNAVLSVPEPGILLLLSGGLTGLLLTRRQRKTA
jgi:hypothetical protein